MDVSIYRQRSRDVLTLCVLALLLLGVLMVQSASMYVYQDRFDSTGKSVPAAAQMRWSWTEQGTKQLLFAAVAIVTFGVVGRIDYTHLLRGTQTYWRNPILWCFAIASLMCLVVLIPGIGNRMKHEFEEYRPYRNIEQFRREIGKYVSKEEVARLEQYVTIK